MDAYDWTGILFGATTGLFVWYLCTETWGLLGFFMGIIPAFILGFIVSIGWPFILLAGIGIAFLLWLFRRPLGISL